MELSELLEKIKIIRDCDRCGRCCYCKKIYVTEEELNEIREYVNNTGLEIEFYEVEGIHIVLKQKEDGSCIFLQDHECLIQPVKPFQCRTYPVIYSPAALVVSDIRITKNLLTFLCQSGKCAYSVEISDFIEGCRARVEYLEDEYAWRLLHSEVRRRIE